MRIAADLAEHRLDLTVRKEILWESETATDAEVREAVPKSGGLHLRWSGSSDLADLDPSEHPLRRFGPILAQLTMRGPEAAQLCFVCLPAAHRQPQTGPNQTLRNTRRDWSDWRSLRNGRAPAPLRV